MSIVVNKQKNQSGFSIAAALGIIVAIAIVGIGLLVVSIKNQNKQNGTNQQNSQKATQSTTTKTWDDSGHTLYTNTALGFQFEYPKDWGKLQVTGDGTLPPVIGTASDVTKNKDYPFYSGTLSFAIATRSNYSITGQKKGATYIPVLKNNSYSNYVWKVISVDPADTTDKVGDVYEAPVSASGSGALIYDFNYNDGNTNIERWVFETKAGFVTLSMPAFGSKNGKQPTTADITAHENIVKNITESIQLIY